MRPLLTPALLVTAPQVASVMIKGVERGRED